MLELFSSEYGKIIISESAVESIIKDSILRVSGLKFSKKFLLIGHDVVVMGGRDGTDDMLEVRVTLCAPSGLSLIESGKNVQNDIRESVLKTTGLDKIKIDIVFDSIDASQMDDTVLLKK